MEFLNPFCSLEDDARREQRGPRGQQGSWATPQVFLSHSSTQLVVCSQQIRFFCRLLSPSLGFLFRLRLWISGTGRSTFGSRALQVRFVVLVFLVSLVFPGSRFLCGAFVCSRFCAGASLHSAGLAVALQIQFGLILKLRSACGTCFALFRVLAEVGGGGRRTVSAKNDCIVLGLVDVARGIFFSGDRRGL